MNRLYYMLLVLFSLFYVTGATATVDWDGSFSGQSDGFQRGDRIIPGHMNEIDAALDSIKADVDGLTESSGDFIEVDGVETTPTGAPGFNLVSGDGINITLDTAASPDSGTFGIDLFPTGPGLAFSANQLTLLRTCADNQILQWDPTAGWECQNISSAVTVNGAAIFGATYYNFNSTSPAAALGSINLPFALGSDAQGNAEVSVSLALSDITSLGTLTTQLALDDDGISFQTHGAIDDCNTQFPPNGNGIYFDGTAFKKCVLGTETNMDTNGAATALQGTASGSIDMGTHQLTGDYQCIAESIVSISTDEVYACLATPAGTDPVLGADYASLMKIMVTPNRPDANDPELGPLLKLALDACYNSSAQLDVDNNGQGATGCYIEVAAGKYVETQSTHFNDTNGVVGPTRGGVHINLNGSEIRPEVPAFDGTGYTLASGGLNLPTCNDAAFGAFYQVTDGVSPVQQGSGGGTTTLPVFCNGNSWEIGYATWVFGGPGAATLSNVTINLPFLKSDATLSTNSPEEYARTLVISADSGSEAGLAAGGIHQLTLLGGAGGAGVNAPNFQTILDIGGSVGGSGGDQGQANETRCEGVVVQGFDGDFFVDTGQIVWVRNCSDVHLDTVHIEHGGRLRIGEDVTNERLPKAVVMTAPHIGGSNNGPSLLFESGHLSITGGEIEGDWQAGHTGDLARIGGAVAPGVIFNSSGTIWESANATDGQVFLGNIKSWYQFGGEIITADGHSRTKPMFVADDGAKISKLKLEGLYTTTTDKDRIYKLTASTQAEITANSYRDTSFGSNADICFNEECEAGYDKVLVLNDAQTASQRYAEFLAPYMTDARGTEGTSLGIPEGLPKVKIIYDLVGEERLVLERDCYDGDVDRDDIAGTNGAGYVGDWPYAVCFGFMPVRNADNWTLNGTKGNFKGWPDASGVRDRNAPLAEVYSNQTVQITHVGRIEIDQDENDDNEVGTVPTGGYSGEMLGRARQKDTVLFEWGNAYLAGSTTDGVPTYGDCVDNFNATAVGSDGAVDWFADGQNTARYPWDPTGTESVGLAAYPDGRCDNDYSVPVEGIIQLGIGEGVQNFGDLTIFNVDKNETGAIVATAGESAFEGIQSMSSTERASTASDTTVVYWAHNGSTYIQDNAMEINIQNGGDSDDIMFHTWNSFGSSPPRINIIQGSDGTGAMMYGAGNFSQGADWNLKNLNHTMVFGDPENGTDLVQWQLRCTDSFNFPVRTDESNPVEDSNQISGIPDGYCDDPNEVVVGPGRPALSVWPSRCPAVEYSVNQNVFDGIPTRLTSVYNSTGGFLGNERGVCKIAAAPPRGFKINSGMGEGPTHGGITFASAAHRISVGGYYEAGNNPVAKQVSLMPYFCDGVSGTNPLPRGSIALDPANCASTDTGRAMRAEIDTTSIWTKGQTSPGTAATGYNDDNAGRGYGGGAQGNIILNFENMPKHIAGIGDTIETKGWNMLLGPGCGYATTVTVENSMAGYLNQDNDGNEFWVAPELLAGVNGCTLITEMPPGDGLYPLFEHGTLTTTLDDNITKAYSKWGTTAAHLADARQEIYVEASVSGNNFNRSIDNSDIQHAIDLACQQRGSRQEKCADVILPAGDYNLGTIYLTGTGVAPSASAGEGVTGLTFRGAGGVSKFNGQDLPSSSANFIQNTQCATTVRYALPEYDNGVIVNDEQSNNPMFWVHGGRDVTIADMCIVLDGAGQGATGSPNVDTNIGVLVTADDSDNEESYGVRLENVNISGWSGTYTADQTLTNACVVSAPYGMDYQNVTALRSATWAGSDTVNNLTVSNSYLGCDYGWVGGAGISERNVIENTVIEYGITGIWAEDSGVSVKGGRSYTHAQWGGGPWITGEDAICAATEEWMKISMATSSVYVADHTVDADCGIGVYSSHNNFASYLPVDMVNTTLRVGGETEGGLTDTQDYVIDLAAFTTGHFKFSGSVEALYGEDFIAAARVNGTVGGPAYVDMTGSNLWDWDLPFGSGGVNVSQTGFAGVRAPNGWVGVVKQQTDSRFGLADNTIASWREDQFAFENKISIGTIPDQNGNFATPTVDAEIGLAHTSQTNVSAANSANPDTLASNIYSKTCAGGGSCGVGVSVLHNSAQIERLSMDGAGNTVLDMTNGSTGTAGDVVINNGGLTVDEDLVVGDGAGMLEGTVEIGGESDQPQLVIEGFSTQSDSVLVVQNDADAQVFNVNNDGAVYAQSIGDINTGAASNWNVTEAGAATFGSLEIAATGVDTLFQYNDTGFDGQNDYSAVDGAGVGANTGGADGRDGFYGLGCSPAGPTATFLPNGCSFRISVGRDLGNPEFEIEDKTVDSINVPGFGVTPQALRNNIIIDAPIIQDGSNGSGSIDMGHGTIQGAVAVTNLPAIGGIGTAKGGWHFAPSATGGAGRTSVALASPGQSGRNACVYASGAGGGDATVIIKTQSGCTDLYSGAYLVQSSTDVAGSQWNGSPDGQCDALARQGERTFADIIINGTIYTSGATTAPTITSSGSIGDFVCFLSANPNSDASFEWYVLGQSGTWTGADGS